MTLSDRANLAAPVALAGLTAAAAGRLLAPRGAGSRPVPVRPETIFSAEQIRAGRAYRRPQSALALARIALELGALGTLVSRVGAAPPPSRSREPGARALQAGLAGVGLNLGGTALGLPLGAVSRRRALRAGQATDTWASWAQDVAKSSAIEAGLVGALLGGSSLLASRTGPRWWRWAAGATVGVSTLAGLLGPVLLDPVFNHFDPLAAGETRTDVLALADRAGVRVGEVFSVDASRRGPAVNAYVNGLGPTKRVVLFDTLLTDFDRDEVRFVVAHELGHVRHRDVLRQIAFLALCAPSLTHAIQRLTLSWAGELSGPRAVPALSLAGSVAAVPLALSGAALSRAVERRTDQVGLELCEAPEALISFFKRIAVQNLADVSVPGRLRALLASHPPITERIGAALAVSGATPPAPVPRTPAGS